MKAEEKVKRVFPYATTCQPDGHRWQVFDDATGQNLCLPQIHKSWAWAEAWRNIEKAAKAQLKEMRNGN